jgi:hypothetical protein
MSGTEYYPPILVSENTTSEKRSRTILSQSR